jgi:hypothetical protein
MSSVCAFVTKFASLISCVLSCFDRVIFKGYLPNRFVTAVEYGV